MKKKKRIIVAALILTVGIAAFFLKDQVFKNKRIDNIMDHYSWKIPVSELDEELLTDGQLTEKSCALIDSVLDQYEAGSEKALRLAAYALMRTENGYPEETARRKLADQIAAIDVSEYYNSSIFETFIQEAPWTTELLLERYNGTDSIRASSVLKKIAESSSGLPLDDRVRWALTIDAPDFTGMEFLSASLTEADLPELRMLMTESTDPEQLGLCAQALAEQANMPEEIVPILHHFRQAGLSLGELFPDGVMLSMDLSSLSQAEDLPKLEEPLPADARYLIISRTEHGVQAEQLDQQPDDGYSCHDKADPSVFDVRVETVWMDQMRLDQVPASYADCQWLAVLDRQYQYGGCISDLKDYATGKKEHDQHFFPVYGCLSRLILMERDGLLPVKLVSSQAVNADLDQVVIRWTNVGTNASISQYNVAPRFDSEWKADVFQRFMDGQ